MPIESIMSKFYGESEKRFADIFDACKQLGKAVIFIDEIDSIASSRFFNLILIIFFSLSFKIKINFVFLSTINYIF